MSGTTPLKSSPPTKCSWHLRDASGFGDSTLIAICDRQTTFRSSFRGHSSVGRAPALQAGSQGFESPCLQPRKLSGLSRRSLGVGGHLFGVLRLSRELRLG